MGFNFDGAGFAGQPVTEATPGPVFGLFHETAFDGIAMDVAELFGELGFSEDIEVVVAGLPELFASAFGEFGGLAFENAEEGCERSGRAARW